MLRFLRTRALPLVVVIVVVAACGADSTAQLPPGGSAPPSSALASASPEPPAPSSASPTADTGPIDAQTPEPLVIGGRWLRPADGATLKSYTTTLAAKITSTGDGVTTVDRFVFSARWRGTAEKVVCTVTRPTDSGTWSCKANLLKLGVPPGRVTFSFDVYPVGVPIARSPDGRVRVTYAVPPPKPTDTRWRNLSSRETADGGYVETFRLRWSAPAGYADEFLVYDTWECPREGDRRNVGTPCFVAGTHVDASMLKLIGRASGDARSIKIRLDAGECGPSYSTILLRARNAYGDSAFTVVDVASVPDPRDTMC